jgi:hypothetical protein
MKTGFIVRIGMLVPIIVCSFGVAHGQNSSSEDSTRDTIADILRAIAEELTDEEKQAAAERDPAIPAAIHELVEAFDGYAGLEITKTPEHSFGGPNYVARVRFEPLRPGYKACADHYPPLWVKDTAACPSLAANAAPASGWLNCQGMFYTTASNGCPETPPVPTAPASTPPPRCDFSAEVCKQEAPGGPVLIRSLKAVNVATLAEPVPPGTPMREAARIAEPSRALAGARAASPALRTPAAADAVVAPPVAASLDASRLHLQLRNPAAFKLVPDLACPGGNCQWGNTEGGIPLPAPPLVPVKHVPCEYENVSFYVPENRYCPKARVGDRPAAGAALYISWQADGSPPDLYYHRDDFDGVSMYLYQIIGNSDDRYASNEATAKELAAARTTAMLVRHDHVRPGADGFMELANDPDWPPLCSDERFAGLPQPGRCSGVKIGDRLVATSAHCMRNTRQCNETSVVFGYLGNSATSADHSVDAANVFQCKSIVASRRPAAIGQRGADWAIIELDRDIDAPNAVLAGSGDVHPSVVTTVIGHPLGLPTVVTRLGVVQATTTEYFITNSDTFVGNSGSAVFAAESLDSDVPRVLGLLTGGGYDFEDAMEGGEACLKARWCRDADCLGDDVVYADELIVALDEHTAGP